MTSLEQVENNILAILEEAGEDSIPALLNSLSGSNRHGSLAEIDRFREALVGLLKRGFLHIAILRDPESRRWIPLPSPEALSLLEKLDSLLDWSKTQRLWIWNSHNPRAEVLLTGTGRISAQQILAAGGWPKRG